MSLQEINISIMTAKDIPFAKSLTDYENWGYLESDFRRLLANGPEGCFVAWVEKNPVAIITSTAYEDYAFVGTLIVKPDHRNKKIGERLLVHTMEHLERTGVATIELDGVFGAVPLYRRLGFKDKYLSLRLFRPGRAEAVAADSLAPDPDRAVLEFDRQRTGLNRTSLLQRYLDEFKDSIYTHHDEQLSAFAVVRPKETGYLAIGPCVAENRNAAEQLLNDIVERYAHKSLSLGVPETNWEIVELLLRRGFVFTQPSLRMYRGRKRNYERHVFAILSPEKG
ncbi:MAG: GNAT family N-acetyltransferase [Candidatus Zixiibacteriota bacterium]